MAHDCEQAGADGIELNLSCPSPRAALHKSMGGYLVGQDPELAALAVEATVCGTRLPVIAKMTVHASDVSAVAMACIKAGGSAISGINTARGLIGIDLQTEMPLSTDIKGQGYFSGLSGPLIKPIALAVCAKLAMVAGVPVSAIGGITNWKDTVEFILAGATTVQVCTGVMWYGFTLGKRLHRGLVNFMKEKGYSSIDDFRGNALKHFISEIPELPETYESTWYVELAKEKCTMCRMCLTACRDSSSGAIEEVNGTLHIDEAKCTLCGLCLTVCKPEALTLRRQ